ncbi:MAG: UDP-N-acetylmuramoylalanine--D-glutamate ligase [Fimbriimonadaceae bacterium]|nr:UDP-N-acetylmuramoylalanine--D-glutamate ligase [Fimbriimonadaceae bacterium]
MEGKRAAVTGMGRSGMAIARAALARGARVTVFDEKPGDDPHIISAVDKLQQLGAEPVPGWHGHLDPADFDLLVPSPGFRREHPAIRDMLAGDREVISEVEFAYRIARSPILAITGTNGKSTTTVMLYLLLQAAGKNPILCGNIAGSGFHEVTLTEAAETSDGVQPLVAEVSSYQLEWVRDFRPLVATLTNVTPDHMERHPTFEDYLDTKLRLFARMGEGDTIVLNEREISTPVDRVLRDVDSAVGLRLVDPALSHEGARSRANTRREGERLVLGNREVHLADLSLFGDHQVVDAMLAWEMATAFIGDVEPHWEAMLRVLIEFPGLHHRLERVAQHGGVLVINSSMTTNPAAVIACSKAVPGKQFLLMGGLTKNLDFRPVGTYLHDTGHTAILFGADNDELACQLGIEPKSWSSLEEAFKDAAHRAQPGEVIMLAPGCASAPPYADFRERGDAFRRIAREWIEA